MTKSRKEVLSAVLGYLGEGTFEMSYNAFVSENKETLHLTGSGQMSEGPFGFTAEVSESKVHLVTYSPDPCILTLEDVMEAVGGTSAIAAGEIKLCMLLANHPHKFTGDQLALWLKG